MAGNKNSGRKGRHIEVRINELSAKCVNWALNNWNTFSKDEKMRLAITLGPKYVVQQTENHGVSQNIIIIRPKNQEAIETNARDITQAIPR